MLSVLHHFPDPCYAFKPDSNFVEMQYVQKNLAEWKEVEFMFSKKATKIDEIFTVDLAFTKGQLISFFGRSYGSTILFRD